MEGSLWLKIGLCYKQFRVKIWLITFLIIWQITNTKRSSICLINKNSPHQRQADRDIKRGASENECNTLQKHQRHISHFSDTDMMEFSPENRRTLYRTIVQCKLDDLIQDGKLR